MEYRETIAILEKFKLQKELKTIDEIIAEEFPSSLIQYLDNSLKLDEVSE
jgi:hypothetical protein